MTLSVSDHKRAREELREKLDAYDFDYFVTLAPNSYHLKDELLRDYLRQWDARVNHFLNGGRWAKKPDERCIWFAFPEGIDNIPHWHLLLDVAKPYSETAERAERRVELPLHMQRFWAKITNYRGSLDCQPFKDSGAKDYALKLVHRPDLWSRFIIAREFVTP